MKSIKYSVAFLLVLSLLFCFTVSENNNEKLIVVHDVTREEIIDAYDYF